MHMLLGIIKVISNHSFVTELPFVLDRIGKKKVTNIDIWRFFFSKTDFNLNLITRIRKSRCTKPRLFS